MNFKTTPFAHQYTAWDMSKDRKLFALFMEMGTGKSKVLIDTAAHLWHLKEIEALVIVAPKGVYLNWLYNELPTHMPDDVPYNVAFWSTPLKYDDKRALARLLLPTAHARMRVLLVNTEAMSHPKAPTMLIEFMDHNKTLMAIDESTSIKSPKASRTKTMVKVGKHAVYKRVMTGTPITKSPLDLYTQCQFLGPELLGYPSYYAFRSRYAEIVQIRAGIRTLSKGETDKGQARIPVKVVGYRNLDKLAAEVKEFSYRVLKEECLDLPEKIFTTRYVELTPEQTRVYNELRIKSLAELRDTTVTVQNVLTKLMRLHQVVCGHTKTDDGQAVTLESNRLGVLLDSIEETDGKSIIWCKYQEDVESIANALVGLYGHDSVVTYYGKTSNEAREFALKTFSDPASPQRFWVGTPTAGGKGLTLVSATTVFYYSYDFDLEVHLQSQDRAHRIGQTKNVTYVYLVAQGTVDQKILRSLREKKKLADIVLDEGREIVSLLE